MFVYRLRFCADELSERREKRSAANALGLGADVDEDLAAGCAAIERKYLEAEEGMNAVLAAGAALRWEAERIAPEAFVRSGEPVNWKSSSRMSTSPQPFVMAHSSARM